MMATHWRAAILAIALAGCRVASGIGVGHSSSATATAGPRGATAANGDRPQQFPGALIRGQLLTLVGLTLDQARQRLVELGHVGTVIVEPQSHFVEGCGRDRVCGVAPESGIPLDGELRLRVNAKLTIPAPP